MNYEQMADQAKEYLNGGDWEGAIREAIQLAAAAGKEATAAAAAAAAADRVAAEALKKAKAAAAGDGIQDPNI